MVSGGSEGFAILSLVNRALHQTRIILLIRLHLHQPFRTRHHGEVLREGAGEVGEGGLHLADQLQDSGKGTIRHGAVENAEATVDGTQNVCAVHGQAEAGVAEVGERIPFHAGRFVCREERLLFGFRLVLFSEDPEHHLGVQPFLVEDPQVAVLLLNGLVELLEPGPEDVGQEDQQ